MHVWRIETLAIELRDDKMTEAKAFRYFFVIAMLACVSWALSWFIGMGTPLTTIPNGFIFPVIGVAITAVGLIVCFRTFQEEGGKQFIQNFICLLLPANIRTFVFCLPLYIVASFIVVQFPTEQQPNAIVLANALIVIIMLCVQFVVIYRYLPRVPHSESDSDRAA